MVRKFIVLLTLVSCTLGLHAQNNQSSEKYVKTFEHLDLSVTAGFSGVGFEFATPLNRFLTVRSGFQFMPKFKPKMSFGLGLEEDENGGAEGFSPELQSRFDEIREIFTGFTGCEIDEKVDMIGEPTMYNFNLLLDVAPFKDKRWHFTAGIYASPSTIAKAYNTTEDMPTLFSVLLYNRMYQSAYDDVPMFEYGDKTVYVDPDLADKLLEYGRMSIYLGEKADGSGSYYMEPDEASMVKVKMKVKPVRPYIGFGFGDTFKNKKNEDTRYSFSFDAGVMFWGGTPEVITHDGTNLAKDVVDIPGKVGDYVRFMKSMKVCPMLNIKLTRRLF